ncbi:hypothetical protein Salat_0677300 [Sesamum alatum]|uniref:Uncharacterized protein n=1 Tax=Sesamum alatum TaxID=300844 RepID=A0AAE2CUN2_9LAMI|nr:hypothetical protein Salat_0677300 [Sesamum alatum]
MVSCILTCVRKCLRVTLLLGLGGGQRHMGHAHHTVNMGELMRCRSKMTILSMLPVDDLKTSMRTRHTRSRCVALNEPSVPLNKPFESFPTASDDNFASLSSGRCRKHHVNELQTKKMDTMDKVQESLQGKIDRTGPKATEAIEWCMEELSKFENLTDQIFTTALERFHSHTTRTMFLKLTKNNKLRWLQSLAKLN